MEIRVATDEDRPEVVALYQRSQAATQIPNPAVYPPERLGDELYARDAIERYVTVSSAKIIGHGLIELPNPLSISFWRSGIDNDSSRMIEFGGAFVDPEHMREGVYSELLGFRLDVIRGLGAIPVSATWLQNEHVQRKFVANGGREVAKQQIPAGTLCLFVF
jgi:hypothetical protein